MKLFRCVHGSDVVDEAAGTSFRSEIDALQERSRESGVRSGVFD